nr:uncharacterized protein LOC108132258 [Drosophila bipectinata]
MKLHQADARKLEFQKYKNLLQAFEWSEWIQREEYLQECQILRLEIVIKMLDKREREMHAASKTRIEQACERIEKRRQADLQKNEIEYQRGMRRITMQLAKTSRKWEKPDTLFALGSRCSEFYAPIRRYGVDPVRRNFEPEAGRRAFDMRIDKLEKQVNMNRLKCPFKKLKEWAEPKLPTHEYEQNFCSEAHLQSLYEFLKRMRKLRDPRTDTPLCLKEKFDFSKINDRGDSTVSYDPAPQFIGRRTLKPWDKKPLHSTRLKEPEDPKVDRDPGQEIQYTDLEALISAYEGKVIGFLMEFLLEESNRMVEQRRLHAFAILSLKERWRREAIEGGNRQKENDLRTLYEDMFQQSISVNNDVADLFIKNILDTDVSAIAANEAAESMNEMALQIDRDIERWLESFKLIQNPLTFIPLRLMLRDMVSPDLDAAVVEHENAMMIQYIVEEVIFDRVWKALEPFDVGSTLTSDLIDRLIDNDLYLFSTDSESDSDHMPSWYEAQAIIRKLIRYSVPGKRWKEENERIVHDIYDDMLDDIFVQLILKYYPPTQERIQCQEYEEINEEEGTDLISIRSDLSTRSIFNVHSDLSSFDNDQDNASERLRVMELTEDNNNLSSQKDVQDDWMCEIN